MTLKLKRILTICLMSVFCLTLFLGQSATHAQNGGNNFYEAVASFESVTGRIDLSALRHAGFSSAVKVGREEDGYRTLIVTLSGKTLLEGIAGADSSSQYLGSARGRAEARRIENEQNAFIKNLNSHDIVYAKVDSYDAVVNAVAIRADVSAISKIKSIPGVESVVVSERYAYPEVKESHSHATSGTVASAVINKTEVYGTGIYNSSAISAEYGYEGQGMVVAVLDTGLDYTHDAFQRMPKDTAKLGLTRAEVQSAVEGANGSTLAAVQRGKANGDKFTANELYLSDKVPFAFDYADNDADVYPSYSSHGVHVAGIIGGVDDSYTDKDGNTVSEQFVGVAPEAQLVICKTFTDNLDSENLGGAVTEDLIAALNDCVKLGVDVINMSLGSSGGFSDQTDADPEGKLLNDVYNSVKEAGISLICAASNDFSAGYGGAFGTNLATNPDSSTVGSPSTYAAAMSVASINGQRADYLLANEGTQHESAVFFEESSDENSVPYDFAKLLSQRYPTANGTYEYVVVRGVGKSAEYTANVKRLLADQSKPRLVLVQRGDNTFKEKVETAMQMGAEGIIVYNNVAGKIKMNLGEIDNPIPAISVTYEAGISLFSGAADTADGNGLIGTITISDEFNAGPFMSDFSSWGCTPDLKLKPEITAHGGEITSTVAGGYDEYSGTSMASPNMAGFTALLRQHVLQDERFSHLLGGTEIENARTVTRLVNQLMMSTATTVYDEDNLPYSPRKQGAGLASLESSVKTNALIRTENEQNDFRPKLEMGEGERDGNDGLLTYTGEFTAVNLSASPMTFTLQSIVMTESLSIDGLAVKEQAHLLEGITLWTVDGEEADGTVTIPAGGEVSVGVTLKLTEDEERHIMQTFKNGMFVEGFVKLLSTDENPAMQCDLVIPFLGFCGDWEAAPMLDYTVFELAEIEQDSSIEDDEKPQAQVWATQAFSSYYNNRYILPMGSYLYELDESDDPMYASEEYCTISRYNDYVNESGVGNYMTSTRLHAVYAGLLRNAREVSYTLTDADTGEVILEDVMYDVAKAMTRGGSPIPANVELKLVPDEYGLSANGKYTMNFRFRMNYDDGSDVPEENQFTFSFYVDYEAPILEDVRVRFYDYKDGNREKQRIYLDFDVFDNRYAQSLMLCYLEGNELKLVTDYITPVRNANKNGTTTVSIEVTDIYEKYGGELYVQVDDYALNYNVYKINIAEAQKSVLPDEFEVVGDKKITLGRYQTHKLQLSYEGSASPANFNWMYDESVISVKNGVIAGVGVGKCNLIISNGKTSKIVEVTVTESDVVLSKPTLSFGLIRNAADGLQTATGLVSVSPGDSFRLDVVPDPWYYPMDTLQLEWSSTNTRVATVDQYGNVTTLKKGTAIINAVIAGTSYSAGVTLRVQDEFTVSNFTLTKYEGVGGRVEIPTDMNIMYIGEEAFENNTKIEEIIIPKSVIEIHQRAFINCTALKRVYFIQDTPMDVADADLTLIHHNAFEGCTALELVDLSNVKTITLGREAFKNCKKLKQFGTYVHDGESSGLKNVGTAHDRAFAGCTSLESVDISALHVSGDYVFTGCTRLKTVITGRYTAIGRGMFASSVAYYVQFNTSTGAIDTVEESFPACTALRSITLTSPSIGQEAFYGCTGLKSVTLANPVASDGQTVIPVQFNIGAGAFAESGLVAFNANGCSVRSIGDRAFASTSITTFNIPNGIEELGAYLFVGSPLTTVGINDSVDISCLYTGASPFGGVSISAYTAPEGSLLYASYDGVLYSKDYETILLYPNGKTVSAKAPTNGNGYPYIIKKVADNAFFGVKTVKGVDNMGIHFTGGGYLSAQIEEFGSYSFSGCTEMTYFKPGACTYLGEGAFMGASKLAEVELESCYVGELSKNLFYGTAITSIEIPVTVLAIHDSAFEGTGLTEIDLYGTNVAKLGSRVFANNKKLKYASLSPMNGGLKEIGSETFYGCEALTKAWMPAVEALGDYTFYGTPALESVEFGIAAKTLGNYTFVLERRGWDFAERTASLTLITHSFMGTVGDYAFYKCSGLVIDDEGFAPLTIGEAAFYGTESIKELYLSIAERIGDYAFAYSGLEGTVRMQEITEIGSYAFYSVPATSFIISVSNGLEVGDYAFASLALDRLYISASELSLGKGTLGYTTAGQIEIEVNGYEANDCVIYRRISDGYELVSFNRTMASPEFTVPEGFNLVSVGDGAFEGASRLGIKKVVLPYTLKVIGDKAFFASGIEEYCFNSLTAPELRYVYREEGAVKYTPDMQTYTGQFYANFETYLVDYYTKESELTVCYPENATGYGNFVYGKYFGRHITTGIHMTDYTRQARDAIDALLPTSTVEGWLSLSPTEENRATVLDFATKLSLARTLYSNVTDEAQRAFLTAGSGDKLTELETLMRSVKKQVGIAVNAKSVTYTGEYKKDYYAGEYFDATASGLQLVIVYDDGSTEQYTGEITLADNQPLGIYDRSVKVIATVGGRQFTVSVAVSVAERPQDSTSGEQSSESSVESAGQGSGTDSSANDDGGFPIGALMPMAVAVVIAAAVVMVIIKRKNIKQ